jgi:condensin-2 complex subunit H2
LEPKLQEEEKRRTFDIHIYGEEMIGRVVTACRNSTKTVAFAETVQGLSTHDICRSFLATLQLANDGNVDISLSGTCIPHFWFRCAL